MFMIRSPLSGPGSAARLRRRVARATRRRLEGCRTGWFPPAALAAAIGAFVGGASTAAVLEVFLQP